MGSCNAMNKRQSQNFNADLMNAGEPIKPFLYVSVNIIGICLWNTGVEQLENSHPCAMR